MTNLKEREQRMMELSMYHISKETYNWIISSGLKKREEDETGLEIPINKSQLNMDTPEDLKLLMQTADSCNCGYLMLDFLGKEVSCFPSYKGEWT